MKTKITRNKSPYLENKISLDDKLKGIHCFNIIGPCAVTGVKVSARFYGTRREAMKVRIVSQEQDKKENPDYYKLNLQGRRDYHLCKGERNE